MGYYVDKLQQATTASLGTFDVDSTDLQTAIDQLDDSKAELNSLQFIDTMFGGEVDGAIRDAAGRFVTYLDDLRDAADRLRSEDGAARGAFEAATVAYDSLPSGQPNFIESALGSLPQVEIPFLNVVVTGQEYLNGVIARREQEREEQAREAMRTLREALTTHASTVVEITVKPVNPFGPGVPVDPPITPPGDKDGGSTSKQGPTPPGSRNRIPGHGSDNTVASVPSGSTGTATPVRSPDTSTGPHPTNPGPIGGIDPTTPGHHAGTQPVPGGFTPVEYPPVEVPNTVIPPVSEWPLKVYRPGDLSVDGPLDGGYSTPRDPSHGSMPRDPYLRQFIEERQGLAQGGFGVLGAASLAGAALAARGGIGGVAAMASGMGGGAGVGGAALPGAAGAGNAGAIGSSTGGAAGASPGGVGAGAGGAGGAAQGAGARGGGAGAGMMGGAGGSAAQQEDAKSKRRRKYGRSGVEFFDQAGVVDPGAAGAAGIASDAVIDVNFDGGERW